jgi:diguanylate cyclase (GGDEF)-like protein/PAS domain S-box-containing protein
MNSEQNNRRILIIDDNRGIHDDFRKILCPADIASGLDDMEKDLFGAAPAASKREKYDLHSAYQGQEGLELVKRSLETGDRYALAFVDMRMPPGWDGVETIEKIWEVDPEIQIVICTAYSDYSWEEINGKFGAADRLLILKKPYDTAEVCQLACSLTQKWRLAKHAHLKLNQLASMVKEQTRQLEDANTQLMREVSDRAKSQERYRLVEEAVNDGLWDWDIPAGKIYYSSHWKSMLGFSDAEIGDSPEEWFGRIHADDRTSVMEHQKEHFQGRSEQLCGECRMLHKDGQYRWILYRGLAVGDDKGVKIRAVGTFTDITDRKLAEEQLRFEAMHDALTGLANRVKLADRLSCCIARRKRESDFHFAVMFIDLDRFKVINDSLGHQIGDKLLVEIARRLKVFVREGDTVARHQPDHVARIGGDEFVLVLENIRHESDILFIAERLHREISGTFHIDGHEICALLSLGVAFGNETYHTAAEILRDADTALYQAKSDGKSCTRIFDPKMHERAVTRWQTETELRKAITENQLVLHYQPIVGTNGKPLAMEALVRWQHPTRGLLPPGEFIPIAEDTDLIIHLGRWVLMEACRQAKQWQMEIPLPENLSISVNVSSNQFSQPGFAAEVTKVLYEAGLAPHRLRLEITESMAMTDAATVITTLTRLRSTGVTIDLDDFGTGYSSLSSLHRMPLNNLKIDKSFVHDMRTDKVGHTIVQTIIKLAHLLELRVVAEGVETQEQINVLRTMGCDYLQGYFISKPLPVSQAADYLSAAAFAGGSSKAAECIPGAA